VSRSSHTPPELVGEEPFLGSWAVGEGLLTPDQLRSSSWRRLFRGVYVHTDLPVTHEVRARAACVLMPSAVVTGRSAAVVWGVELAGAADDVEVTVPSTSHPCRLPGLRVRRTDLPRAHRWQRAGIPVTTPEATTVRLAGLLTGDAAVVAVDQMIAAGVVDLSAVRALAGTERGPGSARARRACALADGLAGSPQETRLRLLMRRSALPMPVAQYRVFVGGRSVARVDFAWPEHKVALEYDGLWHAEPGQFAKDRRRLNQLTAAGWRVIFVTAADLRSPEALLARIVAALGQ
jgi:very-short-patch-repair endonuclease